MPIVTRETFDDFVGKFSAPGKYAVDTETTGLRAYLGDSLFSIIVAGPAGSFYLNFKDYPGLAPEYVLSKTEHLPKLKKIFDVPESTWFAHNAKFDLAMLFKDGLEIQGRVHCTEAIARLLYNRHFVYSLDACAKRIGLAKSKAVDEYVTKNRLYTKFVDEDTGKEIKQMHFDRVPFDIISAYGLTDGDITYKLGLKQLEELRSIHDATPSNKASIAKLYLNETALTKTCFVMERTGIKINKTYSKEAFIHEANRARDAAKRFSDTSGTEFKDSALILAKAFDAAGEAYPRTKPSKTRPLGTPSFTDAVLEDFTSPLAEYLREYRDASKKANTYYANFLKYADHQDRIHANIRQAGTDTGRFSYNDPNLQNLSKESNLSDKYIIRRAFEPTNEDYCLLMIDYDQMEYRLMLDYAGEMEVIRQIVEEGLDVHAATALQMGVTRDEAKTLNFLLLYGGGVKKLALKLKRTVEEARELRAKYFRKLPNVRHWSQGVTGIAEERKLLTNWFGRRYHFPYVNDEVTFAAYIGPNHIIQGGCADVVRIAMNRCHELLLPTRSRMLVQVHDELVFELHKSELHLGPLLLRIMQEAYPHRFLPLTCGASHSWKSWADKIKGFPA